MTQDCYDNHVAPGQLAEAQVHSDRRLDALIDVVDKLTRRNRPTEQR